MDTLYSGDMSFLKRIFVLLVGILALLAISTGRGYAVVVTDALSTSMQDWYEGVVGASVTTDRWGVYVMQPLGDKLYLGFNRSFPSADAGQALLASFDGSALSSVAKLYEDAVYRIKASRDKIFISSYDPDGEFHEDAWDAGNLYTYDPTSETFTKMRYRYSSYQFVDATTTSANGTYTFTNLKNTSYMIKVILPADYIMSPQYQPGSVPPSTLLTRNGIDSNFESNGEHVTCTREYDRGMFFDRAFTDAAMDAGLRPSPGAAAGTPTVGVRNEAFYGGQYTLASQVWGDTDADGIQDAGEVGIPGVRVEIYTKDPYFPCAVHMPAMWVSEDGQEIIVNYGHVAPGPYFGFAFYASANSTWRSTDAGATWQIMSTMSDSYFAYDLFKFNDYVFRVREIAQNTVTLPTTPTSYVAGMSSVLLSSSNNGQNWQADFSKINRGLATRPVSGSSPATFYGMQFDTTQKLLAYHGRLIFPSSRGTELYRYTVNGGESAITQSSDPNTTRSSVMTLVYNKSGTGEVVPTSGVNFLGILPHVTDADFPYGSYGALSMEEFGHMNTYNTITTVDDEYIYALGADKKLYISTTGKNWTTVADFSTVGDGNYPISIAYWPARDWLMVATTGDTASIYYIDHSEAAAEVLGQLDTAQPSVKIVDTFDQLTEVSDEGSIGQSTMYLKEQSTITSKFSLDLQPGVLDWSSVRTGHDRDRGKSFVSNLTSAPQAPTTHDLYMPIPESSKDATTATICPHAQGIGEVELSCPQGVVISLGETKDVLGHQVRLERDLVDGQWYLIARGVTGTGGIAHLVGTAAAQGNSSQAEALCADLKPGMLAPQIVSLTHPTSASAYLVFTTAETPYNSYLVRYGMSPDDLPYSSTFNADPTIITHQINDLLPEQTYYFQMRASNGCAAGPWSSIVELKPLSSTRRSSGNNLLSTIASVLMPQKGGQQDEVWESASTSAIESSPLPSGASRRMVPTSSPFSSPVTEAAPVSELTFWQRVKAFFSNLFQ